MIKLNFKIDNDFLIGYIFHSSNPNSKKLIPGKDHSSLLNFQNAAWNLDSESYKFIGGGFTLTDLADHSISKKAIVAETFLKKCASLPEFKKVLEETQEALEKVKTEWEQGFEKSSTEMATILGYSPVGTFTILIGHPSFSQGRNLGNGMIQWTYRDEWENYNTIYLWHEILHTLIPKSGGATPLHALVELIADNELRARLNGITYPPFEGHLFLEELKEKMLPDWKEYLSQEKRNIEDLKNKLLKKYS